jgi:hypothetical protein
MTAFMRLPWPKGVMLVYTLSFHHSPRREKESALFMATAKFEGIGGSDSAVCGLFMFAGGRSAVVSPVFATKLSGVS